MNQEKINCFLQKNKKYFSSEYMIKMQEFLRNVPDDAFFVLINHKPHSKSYYRKLYNNTIAKKYFRFSLASWLLLYPLIVSIIQSLFLYDSVFEDWGIDIGNFIGVYVVTPLLLLSFIVLLCLAIKNKPKEKMKPYSEYVFKEYCDLMLHFKHE